MIVIACCRSKEVVGCCFTIESSNTTLTAVNTKKRKPAFLFARIGSVWCDTYWKSDSVCQVSSFHPRALLHRC